jgi:hypothetical protein
LYKLGEALRSCLDHLFESNYLQELRDSSMIYLNKPKSFSKKGSTRLKGCTGCSNTPPKRLRECEHSLAVGRGELLSKIHFLVVLSMEKGLYFLSTDFSSSKLAFEVS